MSSVAVGVGVGCSVGGTLVLTLLYCLCYYKRWYKKLLCKDRSKAAEAAHVNLDLQQQFPGASCEGVYDTPEDTEYQELNEVAGSGVGSRRSIPNNYTNQHTDVSSHLASRAFVPLPGLPEAQGRTSSSMCNGSAHGGSSRQGGSNMSDMVDNELYNKGTEKTEFVMVDNELYNKGTEKTELDMVDNELYNKGTEKTELDMVDNELYNKGTEKTELDMIDNELYNKGTEKIELDMVDNELYNKGTEKTESDMVDTELYSKELKTPT